jgi:putative methyltransferase (TIGR04325 family)
MEMEALSTPPRPPFAKRFKTAVKDWLPPWLLRKIGSYIWVNWAGDYPSWQAAAAECSGYDQPVILEKVRDTLLRVKNGEIAGERDSMPLARIEYSFPLLMALNYAARRSGNRLSVLDFGGSLGTSYYQNRGMLHGLREFHWSVVEQPHFVEEGRRSFADHELSFYPDVKSALAEHSVNFALLSGVLPFLEQPEKVLEEIFARPPEFILLDRTPVMLSGRSRITKQTVPKRLYPATYPCWIRNHRETLALFESRYELILEGVTEEKLNLPDAVFCFVLLQLRGAQPSPSA